MKSFKVPLRVRQCHLGIEGYLKLYAYSSYNKKKDFKGFEFLPQTQNF